MGTLHSPAADLVWLDLDEHVADPFRPGHRSGLPGRCEQVVVRDRFGESANQNAPAGLGLLIEAVDLERDAGSADELG